MAQSLDTMPAELQLNVFRLLLPHPDETERPDLADLRLTCKSVLSSATDVFFERYYLLLRKENDIYVEPRSFQLLRKHPRYAALVRTVWIALAIAPPGWLRQQAAFGHGDATGDTTLNLAYKATDMYIWDSDCDSRFELDMEEEILEECRKDEDFTPEQYESIREYHQDFVALPSYDLEYQHPISSHALEVVLTKRLRILPNARNVRLAPPPITQTPFYTERLDFWKIKGFKERPEQLSKPQHTEQFHGIRCW
jgi:hypothetical protein